MSLDAPGSTITTKARRGPWGVRIAALALLVASWAALQLARPPEPRDEQRALHELALPEPLPGFRADAWYLPDEPLLGFVEVPAGPFTMGSDPSVDPLAFDVERWSATSPQGTVDMPTYYIGRYEVTVAQYLAFAKAAGHRVVDMEGLGVDPRHPVANVAWTDALAYARWLTQTLASWSGTPPELARLLVEGWEVRLPNEAEWEKAARDADARIWPWGNEPRRDPANLGRRGASPVGAFDCPECPYGLADMAGNVWEWTRSPYRPYPFDSSLAGIDLEADALWVMRGGSYAESEQNTRAAVRGGADPGARRSFIGFRVVISRP